MASGRLTRRSGWAHDAADVEHPRLEPVEPLHGQCLGALNAVQLRAKGGLEGVEMLGPSRLRSNESRRPAGSESETMLFLKSDRCASREARSKSTGARFSRKLCSGPGGAAGVSFTSSTARR